MVKDLPAMQEPKETWVQSLGQEGMATHFSILSCKIPMDRGAWRIIVHRITKSLTRLKQLSTHTCTLCKECDVSTCEWNSRSD